LVEIVGKLDLLAASLVISIGHGYLAEIDA
jgi:hypothetical protein